MIMIADKIVDMELLYIVHGLRVQVYRVNLVEGYRVDLIKTQLAVRYLSTSASAVVLHWSRCLRHWSWASCNGLTLVSG